MISEKLSQLEPVSQAVSSIQQGLAELHAYTRARQDLERQTADSIRRLETVIAGTQTKGAAGENILEDVFARLPMEWQVRNEVLREEQRNARLASGVHDVRLLTRADVRRRAPSPSC